VNNDTPSAFSSESTCLPTVGWVSPSSRAAADREPVRNTLKNERYRFHSGADVAIQIYIAELLI
jgi:hypothetical protein